MQHEADHRLPPETAETEGEREKNFHLELEGFPSKNLGRSSAGSRAYVLGILFIGSVILVTNWLLGVDFQNEDEIRMWFTGLL